jgi:hypothetical protein
MIEIKSGLSIMIEQESARGISTLSFREKLANKKWVALDDLMKFKTPTKDKSIVLTDLNGVEYVAFMIPKKELSSVGLEAKK